MRFKISFFFSDEYTKNIELAFCMGDRISEHTTLVAAKTACSDNIDCGCIDEEACNGGPWRTHKGFDVHQSAFQCAWTKSKLTFPFRKRRLLYFTM